MQFAAAYLRVLAPELQVLQASSALSVNLRALDLRPPLLRLLCLLAGVVPLPGDLLLGGAVGAAGGRGAVLGEAGGLEREGGDELDGRADEAVSGVGNEAGRENGEDGHSVLLEVAGGEEEVLGLGGGDGPSGGIGGGARIAEAEESEGGAAVGGIAAAGEAEKEGRSCVRKGF